MTDRPFVPRRPPDERSYSRPPFRGPTPGPGRPALDANVIATSVRLKDGEREVEVSGGPAFVRQILDDLPGLLARLRGEVPPTPAAIRMPAPSAAQPPASPVAAENASPSPSPMAVTAPPPASVPTTAPPPPAAATNADGNGAPLESRVLAALRGSSRPLPVAAIRDRLGSDVTGQQVRRILERAGSRVVASGDRPIRYRLR